MTTTDVSWDAGFEQLLTSVLPRVTSPLDPALDLKAVGLDSMATIELLVRLEDQYDLEIPEGQLTGATFATPGALWAVLAAQRAGARA
ncbi:D-alanine--poly(phosphoribitol) ligase subunit 2 [Streptomyces hundungensis]|uniref:D-alanine--poly(Phosphoribitol) ligase subunit 2 n=1 Tax=Streptomyces hundungensis TaxID=1077946 RepID=A0A387HQI4_9ACTN|nr:phosphopantetheine-binding protein [Streptomyces hundungensis]AYG82957.1 D-alanine--poly(phosphoribitol) ligase subunit 2 [Streptomyces hundungensis]